MNFERKCTTEKIVFVFTQLRVTLLQVESPRQWGRHDFGKTKRVKCVDLKVKSCFTDKNDFELNAFSIFMKSYVRERVFAKTKKIKVIKIDEKAVSSLTKNHS